ncbi:MAG: hypothetical protein AABX05_02545, partial [Nanoarchaeota archaeon]
MTKKAVSLFVLLILLSSTLALAQENNTTVVENPTPICGLGCKIWNFFFATGEPIVGQAAGIEEQYKTAKEAHDLPRLIALCDQNYYPACNSAGANLAREKKYSESTNYFEKACNNNIAWGCRNLAIKFLNGDGVAKDEAKSQDFYAKSCALGAAGACEHVSGKYVGVGKVFDYAGYGDTESPENKAARELLFENTFPGEEYGGPEADSGGTAEQNTRLLQELSKENGARVHNKLVTAQSAPPVIDRAAEQQLQSILGPRFQEFASTLGGNININKNKDGNKLFMYGTQGAVVVEIGQDGVAKGFRTIPVLGGGVPTNEYFVAKNGQVLATQTEIGKIKVGSTVYNVEKNVNVIDALTKGIKTSGEEDELGGLVKLDGDVLSVTDYEEEKQTITNTKTREIQDRTGDYYKDGESGCKNDEGCFVPTGGTIARFMGLGKDNKPVYEQFVLDYDYADAKESKGNADDPLEKIDLYDPINGDVRGYVLSDQTKVFAEKNQQTGQYNKEYTIETSDGGRIKVEKAGDRFVLKEAPIVDVSAFTPAVTAAQEKVTQAEAKLYAATHPLIGIEATPEYIAEAQKELDAAEAELETAQGVQEKAAADARKKNEEDLKKIDDP